MTDSFDGLLRDHTLLFDGAMGTMLQEARPGVECNDVLCLTAPDIVCAVHRAYLAAGADIITTNTFGASRAALQEQGLADRAPEMNLAAARIARRAADGAAGPKRFVAGDVGPTSKLPTLGHIDFASLFEGYREQVAALLEGGVDLILIETCQDPLQAKAAAAAARDAMARTGRRIPLAASVTIEPAGTMLLGTEIVAALAALAPYGLAAFGLNCATGPEGMEEQLQSLSVNSPLPILCQPNAGMPVNVEGRLRYALEPEAFAQSLSLLTQRFGIALVGGCCGTSPEHIAALARVLRGARESSPRARRPIERDGGESIPVLSSLYTACALDQEPPPFLIAEQTNVNGSKRFRERLFADDFDALADLARAASAEAHALDLCVASAGRDEVADLAAVARRVALKATAPIVLDSTDPNAIEAALTLLPGRPLINSIHLEDGGEKARRILALARRFGAAVVGLTIDERGMAKALPAKLEVARRLSAFAKSEGLPPNALLIDPLTFTLASGDPALATAGRETLAAIGAIKRELPGVRTILGVSNISFGLPAAGRAWLTSAFLHRAVVEGLDAAIINPARILPLDRIPAAVQALCDRLIDGEGATGEALAALLALLGAAKETDEEREAAEQLQAPPERLRRRIIDGSTTDLAAIVEEILRTTAPSEIIDAILLPAMQEVGRRFAAGRLPLPFVLHAAEAMRAAVDLVAKHLPASQRGHRATIVLATVRGDVHDIGKNLVDAILSNNGYRVINLGIRQPAAALIEAARTHGADAIGLSGLLVSSCDVMREDLEIFRQAGIAVPVLCGGAALTRAFAEQVLARTYGGPIVYCADAFAGLAALERIATAKQGAPA